jgi:hypothetical protein
MQFRELYPDRAEVRNALHTLKSWREIIDTFPTAPNCARLCTV